MRRNLESHVNIKTSESSEQGTMNKVLLTDVSQSLIHQIREKLFLDKQ